MVMPNPEQHEMVLDGAVEGGTVWRCPICGRRIVFLGIPSSRMIVVSPGDRYAVHSGSVGGLRLVSVQAGEELPRVWQDAIDRLDMRGLP